jgi:hypothetical protein
MNSVLTNKPSGEPQRARGSWLSIIFVSMLGMATVAALGVLTLGIMPQVLILGAAIMLFVGLNYIIWGWWLPKILPKEEEEKRIEN